MLAIKQFLNIEVILSSNQSYNMQNIDKVSMEDHSDGLSIHPSIYYLTSLSLQSHEGGSHGLHIAPHISSDIPFKFVAWKYCISLVFRIPCKMFVSLYLPLS